MVVFPNAKLNLGLNVTERRADGFHNLESLFYPVPVYDALEAVPGEAWQFHYYGEEIQPGKGRDTVQEAIALLESHTSLKPAKLCLFKNIPQAAGLGGGSADGTFTLSLLNKLQNLELANTTLSGLSQSIGSDCPFFLSNQPTLVTGKGDQLMPVTLDLSGYYVGIVAAPYPISTAKAYQYITPRKPAVAVTKAIQYPIEEWHAYLVNDFEAYAFEMHPALRAVKAKLYQAGALYASMTGSGSAFYGIFQEHPDLTSREWPDGTRIFESIL